MAAAPDQEECEEFLPSDEEPFRNSAGKIIRRMVELSSQDPDNTVLMDEILHSIFFMGIIHTPPHPPERIVSDPDMLDFLKELFPRPFACYSSQIPKRCPFSCVLDLIVQQNGGSDEDRIREDLHQFIERLQLAEKRLVSTTLCVSESTNSSNPVKFYGVSKSTTGRTPGKIMVFASCLTTWDSCVTDAVLTYLFPKSVFNGNLQVAKYVKCQALRISNGEILPPCLSCRNVYGLRSTNTNKWPVGHCAEAESLSNLLKCEENIKEQVQPIIDNYTERKDKIIHTVLRELNQLLRMVYFKWDGNFYTPQCIN